MWPRILAFQDVHNQRFRQPARQHLQGCSAEGNVEQYHFILQNLIDREIIRKMVLMRTVKISKVAGQNSLPPCEQGVDQWAIAPASERERQACKNATKWVN